MTESRFLNGLHGHRIDHVRLNTISFTYASRKEKKSIKKQRNILKFLNPIFNFFLYSWFFYFWLYIYFYFLIICLSYSYLFLFSYSWLFIFLLFSNYFVRAIIILFQIIKLYIITWYIKELKKYKSKNVTLVKNSVVLKIDQPGVKGARKSTAIKLYRVLHKQFSAWPVQVHPR